MRGVHDASEFAWKWSSKMASIPRTRTSPCRRELQPHRVEKAVRVALSLHVKGFFHFFVPT